MKILVLDNYDSFTYNLVHMLRENGIDLDVFRNDCISVEDIRQYDKILLSPGPGIPAEAGIMKRVIEVYASSKSILGVCLGHQGIAEVFGGTLYNLPQVLHGVTSVARVTQPDDYLFNGMVRQFQVCHYHSWAVDRKMLPECLEVIAEDTEGMILALRHKYYNVRGVQFHPESIMTPDGPKLIKNWLSN